MKSVKTKLKKRPLVGLALGSGGIKGLAHIGVLKVLEKNHIPVDFIAGTSAGALIGGIYALHQSTKQLEEVACGSGLAQAFSLIETPLLGSGLVDEEEVYRFIKKQVGTKKIEECKIPFAAVATSSKKGQAVIFKEGSVFKAIRASMAVPPFFSPFKVANDVLIDGAYVDPVPVDIVRQMGADIVIAVNVEEDYMFQWKKYQNQYGFSLRSVSIFIRSLATLSSQSADVAISPHVAKFGWGDLDQAKKIITIGEKATKFKLEEIKNFVHPLKIKPVKISAEELGLN